MSCPFPGMDPFLEDRRLWGAFHHQLVASLYQILLPGLVDRYRARVQQRCYVTEEPLFTSIIKENRQEEFIEIRHRADGKLVTLIDIASPANKMLPQGRAAYHETRKIARSCNAGIVEIDLVLQGLPLLDFSRDGLPEWDYAVTVTRSTQPDRFEIYTATLAKRLPRFKVPLAPDDRDTVLDLQAAFVRTYEQGNFCSQINYKQEPDVRLKPQDKDWMDGWLKQAKIR
ncbi:DUF4058 family protein [Zavarzinella formosa]|uniref:DUF4058 family protein n=1 Tax=Zavarzinella formosa TaxID=360055 RepID=UPI00030DC2BA|nr:DUF4058 family protein [Zavarzinella formosa]